MILQFGSKVFSTSEEKIYTFDGLTYTLKLSIGMQDAVGKKSSINIKGAEPNRVKFTVLLNSNLGVKPRMEIDEWEKILTEAIAYPLVLGNKALGLNKYLLTDCDMSKTVIDEKGKITSAELALSFIELVAPGVPAPKPSGQGTKKTAGVAVSNAYKVMGYSSGEKFSMKRDTNVFDIKRRGIISK